MKLNHLKFTMTKSHEGKIIISKAIVSTTNLLNEGNKANASLSLFNAKKVILTLSAPLQRNPQSNTFHHSPNPSVGIKKIFRGRRSAVNSCKQQCHQEKEKCYASCQSENLNSCKVATAHFPRRQVLNNILCGHKNAEVYIERDGKLRKMPQHYKYCSGSCHSCTRPKHYSKYSHFISQLGISSARCTPSSFEKVTLECHLHLSNGRTRTWQRTVGDFFINSCGCGVVPHKTEEVIQF